ncbi:DUF1992 domain-containing protein [Nocardioides convexus]|uniref:DnaJ family domain-containing protein n=1 Tax=Nocardioides convexus TaxID=2712224 RepID=UPI0024189990|nr:DUF1992 domain-containing protein [Nocardioides convexus]
MPEDRREDRPHDADQAAARARIAQQQTWVDLQVRQAMERGEFANLPGAGKPIEGLGETHDPDWWVKRLVERERITVLPPALQPAQGRRGARRPPGHPGLRARGALVRGGLQRPGDPGALHPCRRSAAHHHAARRRGDARSVARSRRGPSARPAGPPQRRCRLPRGADGSADGGGVAAEQGLHLAVALVARRHPERPRVLGEQPLPLQEAGPDDETRPDRSGARRAGRRRTTPGGWSCPCACTRAGSARTRRPPPASPPRRYDAGAVSARDRSYRSGVTRR